MKPRQVAFNMLQLIFIINIINPKTLFLFGHTATTRHWRTDFTRNVNSYCSCSSGHIITQLPKCEDFLFFTLFNIKLNIFGLWFKQDEERSSSCRLVMFHTFLKAEIFTGAAKRSLNTSWASTVFTDCEELSVFVVSSAPFRQKLPLFRSLLAHAGSGTERLQDGSRWGRIYMWFYMKCTWYKHV